MGLRNVLKKGFSMGFQPKRWIGLDHVKSNTQICIDLVKSLLQSNKNTPTPAEAVDNQKIEHNLDDKQLLTRKRLALGLVGLYTLVGLLLIGYAVYLMMVKDFILPGCMAVIIAFLVFTYALREFMVFGQIHYNVRRLPLKNLLKLIFKRS